MLASLSEFRVTGVALAGCPLLKSMPSVETPPLSFALSMRTAMSVAVAEAQGAGRNELQSLLSVAVKAMTWADLQRLGKSMGAERAARAHAQTAEGERWAECAARAHAQTAEGFLPQKDGLSMWHTYMHTAEREREVTLGLGQLCLLRAFCFSIRAPCASLCSSTPWLLPLTFQPGWVVMHADAMNSRVPLTAKIAG